MTVGQRRCRGQALALWRDALGESVRRDSPDLSARQMAIFLLVYTTDGPHTVRGLASALRLAKPAVTRALDRLAALGFIRRDRDESDRRSVVVRRTEKGATYLSDFADLITDAASGLDR